MTNKLHYTFTGTLADAINNDICVPAMSIGSVLVNTITRAIYIRTKNTIPAIVGDWTLVDGTGDSGDIYAASLNFDTMSKTLSLLRTDGATLSANLSTLVNIPAAVDIPFNNAGTNFIATNVEAAIKELNTTRAFAKMPFFVSPPTTNKAIGVNDDIFRYGKLYIGISISNDVSKLKVNGGFSSGTSNLMLVNATNGSSILGGDGNTIYDAINYADPYSGQAGSQIIGGKTNRITGNANTTINSIITVVTGKYNILANSNTSNIIGDNNVVFSAYASNITGVQNGVHNLINTNVQGNLNQILYGLNISQFEQSNTNIILFARNVSNFYQSSENIVLKLDSGLVRSDGNLIWGRYLLADSGGNVDSFNVLLGQNVKTSGINNFIWSATEDTLVDDTPSLISHDGVVALLDKVAPTNVMNSSVNNEFMARFSGGFRLRTNAAGTVGVNLVAGGSSWSSVSSIKTKNLLKTITDIDAVLDRFRNIAFNIYEYKDIENAPAFLSTTAEEWDTVLDDYVTPSVSITNGEALPEIRINDQINFALLLLQNVYDKLDILGQNIISLNDRITNLERV